MRINEIYNSQLFGDCQSGFGFQIKMVSDCRIVLFLANFTRVFCLCLSCDFCCLLLVVCNGCIVKQ